MTIYSQRDTKWASIFLGYNTKLPYTIGNYGCLITSFGMYIDKTPIEVNDLLKANDGFQNGGNFVWSKCTILGLNQTYVSPEYVGPVTTQGISKMKELLDSGLPLICRLDFNPATEGEEMHFVLITGYEDDKFFAADPWTGTIINLDVYGGVKRAVIQFRAYDKKIASVDTNLQQELDKCRLSRDNHWQDLMKIKDGLMVVGEYSIDNILNRIDSLNTSERQLGEKEKQLTQVQSELVTISNQLKTKLDDYQKLKDDITNLNKKLTDFGLDINNLDNSIENLKKQTIQPKELTWFQLIVKGIIKIFVK